MKNSTVRTVVILAVTTVLILAGVWVVQTLRNSSGSTSVNTSVDPNQKVPVVGEKPPDFETVTIDGESIRLSETVGRPVWLIFVATWCSHCRSEAPDVQALVEEYEDQVLVISVYRGDKTKAVESYAARLGLTNPHIADTSEQLSRLYALMALPTHFFIDSDGILQQIHVGAISKHAAQEILDTLL